MEIAICCYEGFDDLDAIGPYEVFQNAADAGADCSTSLRTIDDVDLVTASHGLRVEPDGRLEAVTPDLLLIPGGGWNDRERPGAWSEATRGDLPDRIATTFEDGVRIAAVCTGTMLCAEAGVIGDRPVVTHASAMDELRDRGGNVVDARVVDAGEVVTAGGVTSGLDLALTIVEDSFGAAVAEDVATRMEYERRGDVFTTDDSL